MPPVPKPQRIVDEAYREWIRRHGCVVGTACWGLTEVCHVRSRGAGGGDPNNLYPACRKHHAEQHALGVQTFGRKYGFTLTTVAKNLWHTYKGG